VTHTARNIRPAAAGVLPGRAISPTGGEGGGGGGVRGVSSSSWHQETQPRQAGAELLSPPSTCKAPRGARRGGVRARDVALALALPLSDETLSGALWAHALAHISWSEAQNSGTP
jgi:hypothetical protein